VIPQPEHDLRENGVIDNKCYDDTSQQMRWTCRTPSITLFPSFVVLLESRHDLLDVVQHLLSLHSPGLQEERQSVTSVETRG
jgi:hypothetical protein